MRVTKNERNLRQTYFDGAKAILAAAGLQPYAETSLHTDDYGFNGTVSYHAGSDVGPVFIRIYSDWTHIAFSDPTRARLKTGCNPYSGKWNHHTFLSQKGYKNATHVNGCLMELEYSMERVGVRPETDEEKAARVAEYDKYSWNK